MSVTEEKVITGMCFGFLIDQCIHATMHVITETQITKGWLKCQFLIFIYTIQTITFQDLHALPETL